MFRAEWQTDFHHFIVNHMVVGFVLLATNLLVHKLFGWAANDGIRGWVAGPATSGSRVFLIVLVADLVQYWTHRAYHEVPLLWRLHAVHHSVKSMDWLAGSRQHILELIITRTLVLAPIYVLGFSKEVIDAYIVIVGFQAVFNHANVSVRLGPLRYVIVTPNFHHWHHSPGRRGDRQELRGALRLPRLPRSAPRCKSDRAVARALRRGRRLRAERLLQAARVPVRLEGLSAGQFDAVVVGAGAAGPALRGDRRPARLRGAADRPRREGRREDPHLRRRPLQLHQPRRRRRRTSSRPTRTSAARRWRATRRATSSTLVRAPRHRAGTRSTRASSSATRRAQADHRPCCCASATPAASSAGSPARVQAVRARRRRLRARHRPRHRCAPTQLVVATGGLSIPKIGAQRLRLPARAPVRPRDRRDRGRRWCR